MGETVDGRADQYALAASAFHLLTGSPPFPHTNPVVVISRHLNTSPPALSATKAELTGVDSVITKALSKEPDDRYDTCQDFARELAQAVSGSAAAQTAAQVVAAPVQPPTTVIHVAEPTVQHSTPPPVVVSHWAGPHHPADKNASRPPAAATGLLQVWLDALLVLAGAVAAVVLVAMVAFVALQHMAEDNQLSTCQVVDWFNSILAH
jgi:serine/threonine-protein kinase